MIIIIAIILLYYKWLTQLNFRSLSIIFFYFQNDFYDDDDYDDGEEDACNFSLFLCSFMEQMQLICILPVFSSFSCILQ